MNSKVTTAGVILAAGGIVAACMIHSTGDAQTQMLDHGQMVYHSDIQDFTGRCFSVARYMDEWVPGAVPVVDDDNRVLKWARLTPYPDRVGCEWAEALSQRPAGA